MLRAPALPCAATGELGCGGAGRAAEEAFPRGSNAWAPARSSSSVACVPRRTEAQRPRPRRSPRRPGELVSGSVTPARSLAFSLQVGGRDASYPAPPGQPIAPETGWIAWPDGPGSGPGMKAPGAGASTDVTAAPPATRRVPRAMVVSRRAGTAVAAGWSAAAMESGAQVWPHGGPAR
jgi:hypothetical protein